MDDAQAIRALFELARKAMDQGERPFAAALVVDGQIVETAFDEVFSSSDPTGHSEVVVIRRRCQALGAPHLRGHTLYTLAEPCVMCCGAIHWSRLDAVVFGASQASMKSLSGGKHKPSIRDVLPLGRRPLEIRGPVLEAEALEILRAYDFRGNRG